MYPAASDETFSTNIRQRATLRGEFEMERNAHLGRLARLLTATLAAVTLLLAGCTSAREWWHNGLKVGPNYRRPAAPVAEEWIDRDNPQIRSEPARYASWWTVFNDPVLDELVGAAYRENLPLQVAGLRILEARAQRGVAAGNLFAQLQEMTTGYSRTTSSGTTSFGPISNFPKAYFQRWATGFDATWELDFWGRFRREIEAADANLSAQIANYDDVLVILQAEVAATYVDVCTLHERLRLARQNVTLQKDTLKITQDRFEVGTGAAVDVEQATADLAITRSAIPLLEIRYRQAQNRLCVLLGLEIRYRQAQNRLCVLLGTPPHDLQQTLGEPAAITKPPAAEILVGIPAELLRRRPDVRRAEREVAAQSARIGVATSDLYPHFTITGTIGLDSSELRRLFALGSVAGSVGPGFRWDILNYGRILNNIRSEDARFRQSVLNYQQTVLEAGEEVENAMVAFLQERERLEPLRNARDASEKAYGLSLTRYEAGTLDFQRVLDSQRLLVREEDRLAEGQGNVALRLIALYKALGGGWRIRCGPQEAQITQARMPAEVVPSPAPEGPLSTSHDALEHAPLPAEPPASPTPRSD